MWRTKTPPLLLLPPCCRRIRALHQAWPKPSNGFSDFMSWLTARNDDGDLSAVRIGTSQDKARGLFASRPLRAGERVLEISSDLMIAPVDLPDELNSVLPDTIKPWTKLALLVLIERYKGQSSLWAPYISCLPDPSELHNTFLWDDSELVYLRESPLYSKTRERLDMITTEFQAGQNAIDTRHQLFGKVSLEDFKHVYATVFSRALAVGENSELVMIPMLDFLNHNPSTFAKLTFNGLLNYAVVTAERDYAQGEEICISYGNLTNIELAVDYGFVLDANPCNQLLNERASKLKEGDKIGKLLEEREKSIQELNRRSWSSSSRQHLAAAILRDEAKVLTTLGQDH